MTATWSWRWSRRRSTGCCAVPLGRPAGLGLPLGGYLSDVGPIGATGGVWDCPDLSEPPVDGDPDNTRWVMTVNLNPGAVGDFDGTTFTPDGTGEQWLDYGRDYFAVVSYDNALTTGAS
ncbi:hypothetical protein [Corynebacterium variabile]|uniref:hypothetical protein n=1 Tax=Corynebacterium variabile TaxID=1727 RepID=UPI002897696E|nr:hypothetical protein [Corynebacterium variabile]